MAKVLDLKALRDTMETRAAAFRLVLKLEPASPKVFPPTYEGGKYATEERIIGGQKLPCVLLDSVPSQANRMELALQEAVDGGQIQLPVISVDFTAVNNPGVPKVTSLQAPHRIADAILRDSTLGEGKKAPKFRASEIGKELDQLSTGYATPLLKHSPHSLVFGMWDSTGPRGGLGVKFARAVVSEIIGVNVVGGVTTGSRIDPLNIRVQSGTLYATGDGGWTLDEKAAEKVQEGKDKGKAIKLGKDGKPSEANHGNVPPDFVYARDANKNILRDENGRPIHKGGFTLDYAEQTTVLSLPALRRLRFPSKPGDKSTPASDTVARTYLAALGLLGATLAAEAGYDLRSRCILRAVNPVQWTLLGKPGEPNVEFTLDREAAIKLYQEALAEVQKAKLPIHLEEILLTPSDDLVTLVKESMKLTASEGGE